MMRKKKEKESKKERRKKRKEKKRKEKKRRWWLSFATEKTQIKSSDCNKFFICKSSYFHQNFLNGKRNPKFDVCDFIYFFNFYLFFNFF
jgi:hypothetical protein